MTTYTSEDGGACGHCNLALGHHEHLTAKCPPHRYLSAEAAVALGGRPNVRAVQAKLHPDGKPPGPYCQPEMVAARQAPGAAVCIDEECNLSGGYAHVGPCEPCGCELRHAIEECPENG